MRKVTINKKDLLTCIANTRVSVLEEYARVPEKAFVTRDTLKNIANTLATLHKEIQGVGNVSDAE